MRALFYLLLIRFRNRFLSLRKNPAALALVIFLVAVLVVSILTGGSTRGEEVSYRDISEVYAMVTVLYCAIFVMTSYSGLSKGASLYTMPDINLVFTSPITTKKVLLYGLIQQIGTSLFIGFFLLFQYGWMHTTYGITMGNLAFILLGYAVTLFCGQLTAMVLYSFTSGNEKKKGIAKASILGISGLAVLYLLISVFPQKDQWLAEAVSILNKLPIIVFPVGGWVQTTVTGALTGEWINAAAGFSITALFILALVALMAKGDADFYEDVLQATEVSFSAITAGKQGRIDGAMPQNVKVGRIGIGRGSGADSFYYKHRLESRRARVFILDRTNLVFIFIVVVFAFFMKNSGIMPIFIFASYLQIFSVAMGRWIRELLLPYIYLVPEPSYIKLLHCLRESLLRLTAEAFVLFIPVALIIKMTPMDLITCILARISFGLLFTAGNIVVQRFFSGITIKVLVLFLYFLVMILLVLPGIGLVLLITVTNVQLLPMNVQIFLVLALCNSLVSLIAIFICRNMLEYSELNFQ